MATPLLLGNYDPTEQIVILGGQNIDGYSAGTFIKASRTEDTFSFQPSNSGGGSRSLNPNKHGRCEFTLHAGSPANGYLSSVQVSDELNGDGILDLLIKDRSSDPTQNNQSGGPAHVQAQNAWIVKPADYERQKAAGDIAWAIESDYLKIFHAGLLSA